MLWREVGAAGSLLAAVACGGSAPEGAPPASPSGSIPVLTGTWAPVPPPPRALSEAADGIWAAGRLFVWDPLATSDHALGFTYDLESRRWTPFEPRRRADAGTGYFDLAWTGSELIVWSSIGEREAEGVRPQAGALYNPESETWRQFPAAPLVAGVDSRAVWTGSRLLVWGYDPAANRAAFAAYDPSSDQWESLPGGPLSPRWGPDTAWTGRELLIWGGVVPGSDPDPLPLNDGALFDPGAGTWRPIPAAPFDPRFYGSTVWTGTEFVIWGGSRNDRFYDDGAAYDPSEETWQEIPPAPLALRAARAVWDGRRVLIWGGLRASSGELSEEGTAEGFAWDPQARAWMQLPAAGLTSRSGTITVAADGDLLVWGGCCWADHMIYQDGAVFRQG